MRIWITGASGRLGRQLLSQVPVGVKIFSPSRVQVDMHNINAAMPLINQFAPTHIINTAACNDVDKTELEPHEAWSLNHVAVGHLADIAKQLGARLVHISTDFVFDGTASQPYLPTSATNPISEYGKSKEAGEQVALARCSNCIVIRTASLYSINGLNFINTILKRLAYQDLIEVVSDQTTSPTYAASLARCVWQFIPRSETGLWHFTDAGYVSKLDFAQAIVQDAFALGLLAGDKQVVGMHSRGSTAIARRPSFSVLNKDATWSITGKPPEWRQQLRFYLQLLVTQRNA